MTYNPEKGNQWTLNYAYGLKKSRDRKPLPFKEVSPQSLSASRALFLHERRNGSEMSVDVPYGPEKKSWDKSLSPLSRSPNGRLLVSPPSWDPLESYDYKQEAVTSSWYQVPSTVSPGWDSMSKPPPVFDFNSILSLQSWLVDTMDWCSMALWHLSFTKQVSIASSWERTDYVLWFSWSHFDRFTKCSLGTGLVVIH